MNSALTPFVAAYQDAVFDTDRDAAFAVVHDALNHGVAPEEIVFRVVVPASEEMMSRISRDPDANLAQHFMTAQISAEITEEMLKRFSRSPKAIGRVVIGTARGDLHSLGKRIVSGCLKALMVEVIDLGVNVPAERFVEEAVRLDAQIIAISAMMVHTATGPEGARKVRELLRERGLDQQIKLVVGGAPYRFDDHLFAHVGADGWAPDGVSAGKVIIDLLPRPESTPLPPLETSPPVAPPSEPKTPTNSPASRATPEVSPMEILVAAISGRPAPRIPIFCNLLDQGAGALGLSLREYYASGENVALGQLAMRERYGHDNLWSLFYVGKEAELLGCEEIIFAEDGPPNVGDFVIKRPDDIHKLTVPDDITAHPAWRETATCLKILTRESAGRFPICAYLTASTTLPALLMGMDQWMELLTSGPVELRDELLAKCSELFQKQVAAYRAAGAQVLIYSTPFGSPSFVGMKRFEQFSLPWMQRDLEPGGVGGIVYYCGMAPFIRAIRPVMETLKINIHYISPLDNLEEAKALVGTQGLTCGVIDDIKMISWSPEETREEVRRLCAIGMPGEHFLLGTGVMPLAVPEANIRAFIEAGLEWGRYA
ncbi:Glutamate mutase sigma subunit [Candidatus Magnetaquicoccaceae bacterium FCR-1]|uniref:Glutamate mutase sigma subunit n=1 Tax=Candidatus Magnetaquiglobus chichijimensis TaxID=3141448 RepID=A0ABQ0C7N3_9PROT